jgi:penicillin-binding protein 1A
MRKPGGKQLGRSSVSGAGKVLLLAVILAGSGVLLGASLTPGAAVAASLFGTFDGIFDFPDLPDDLGEPWQRSVVYDRDGNELAVIRDENRTVVGLDRVPEHVQDAILATEDAEFRSHEGVNWRAIGRAALSNVSAGEITGGGSTITQQLVKLVLLTDEQTLDRKIQEAVYAIELEQRLTKDDILAAYLNEAYFGNRVYGIATAAEFYWGKDVADLTVDEAALLAGVIRAPAHNDPIQHPDRALARRNIVLGQMVRAGFLSSEAGREAQRRPVELDIHPPTPPKDPYFVDWVREQLMQDPSFGPDRDARERFLRRGGLEIHTTLHRDLQDLAQEVIQETLAGDDDPMGVLTTIDPRTGEVLSLGVGPGEYGSGDGQTSFNPAVPDAGSPGRQSGSAFKPFMLAAALEQGYSPGYTFEGGKEYEFENLSCNPPDYAPGNYGGATHGLLNMSDATTISSNTYFAHLLDQVGYAPLFDVVGRLGLNAELREECSVVLGTANVYPLDMASAFGAFANSGTLCEPYGISAVHDRNGRVIFRGGDDCTRALNAGVADRITDVLRGPVESGTAQQHGQIGRPAAGKTGTTSDHYDAWFVGYVPQLTTAAWVGHEIQREMTHPDCGGGVTGGCLPTMLWQRYMSRAVEVLDLEAEDFPAPPPVPQVSVPDVVGMLDDEAADLVEDLGLHPIFDSVEHWAPAGTVVAQRPTGGSALDEGATVDLDVSDGSVAMPVMPELVGVERSDAEALFDEAGLDYEVDEVPVDDPDWYGRVVAHTPAAGAPLYDGNGLVQELILLDVGRPRTADEPPPETGTPGAATP